ncbi:MAG: hypothetical protein GY812_00030 [Actinomycetia bacterium]|nr:hypothetical protein [Actinomycetes bacterium]
MSPDAKRTDQLTFTEEELLATAPVAEPLVVGGVLCHGGIASDGSYVSPRTLHRTPAIEAWQRNHTAEFDTALIDIGIDDWPANYPSVAQTRFLLQHEVAEPIVASLTRIGTVEGFGSFLRYTEVPDLRSLIVEDIEGTALAHLDQGLIEAHARDEAGWGGDGDTPTEAGHRDMWFAARDVAFDSPATEDQTQLMLQRMGIVGPGGGAGPAATPERLLDDDVDPVLEMLLQRMIRLLMIEISAFHTFSWAEDVLSDTDLVGGEGQAAFLVSCIRADETPHVEYLRAALTELRDRTVVGASGRHHAGSQIIRTIWDRARADAIGPRRDEFEQTIGAEVLHALDGRSNGEEIWEGFLHLAPQRAA